MFLSSVEQTMFQYYVKVVPTTYVDVKGKVSSLFLLKDNYHHLHNYIIFFNRFHLFYFGRFFIDCILTFVFSDFIYKPVFSE